MDTKKIVSLIDDFLYELDVFTNTSTFYDIEKEPIVGFRKVIELLKIELLNNPENINERVLRSVKDVAGLIVKQFEETNLERQIIYITNFLNKNISEYQKLTPLGMSFGKCYPI
jgi:hypothetical protein